VKDTTGKYLKGTDFSLTFKNDKNAGTATIVIEGDGRNYTGSFTKTYTIKKANQSFTLDHSSITMNFGDKVLAFRDGGIGPVTWTPKDSKIVSLSVAGRYCNITGTELGTTEIVVKAAGNSNYNSYSKTIKVLVMLPEPKLDVAYNGVNGIGVQFFKVDGAAFYVIHRKFEGVWSKVKTVKADSDELKVNGNKLMYVDTQVADRYGQGFIYSVAAIRGSQTTTYNTAGIAIYRLHPVNPTGVKTGDGTAKISWSKVDCHGYEVQYYETGTTTPTWVKAPQTTSLSQVISGLKAGKTYGFRVRSFKTNPVRGTYFSEYSKVIYVKL